MADLIDDKVRICYQRDLQPGLAVVGDQHPFDLNDIVYLSDSNLNYGLGLSEASF